MFAQDDLSVQYAQNGIPDILNVCGLPDTAFVTISTVGINTSPRTNIIADLKLAGGVRITSLLTDESSTGVVLNSGINTNTPQFSIPDLSPAGTDTVIIAILIRADCSINDSLAVDPNYDLQDTWDIQYTISGLDKTLNETLNSYRAALRIPELVVDPVQITQKVKPGDCLTRFVKITNTGLDVHLRALHYEVLTTSGLTYNSITVNGTAIDITKTAVGAGDTIIAIDIPGSYFINNGNTNNDTLFNSNEEVNIQENFCVANCISGYQSTHTASYGCFGETCNNFINIADISAGQGNISIDFDDTNTTVTQQNVGYCQEGISPMKITNTGVSIDPGFADIYNIRPGIGLGSNATLSAQGYTITSIEIQGIVFVDTNVLKTLDGNAAFLVDPDGPNGLADLDGDGYFDDLPEGESIEIVAHYEFNCGDAANFDLSTNCDTAFTSRLSTFLEFEDPCQTVQTTSKSNYHTIINQKVVVENYATTDIDAGTGDIFYINHIHDRRFFNFDKGCANGNYYVELILPQGIHLDSTHTSLIKDGINNYTLVSNIQSNDTLLIKFDQGVGQNLNGSYELNLAFTADCTTADGQIHLTSEFGFECPDCNCQHIWYCANITATYVHVKNPPCPSAPSCDNAIRTDAMDFSRTTFGFSDEDYTTADTSSFNKKSALNCDTMLLTIEGVAGNAFSGDDVGIDFSYANPLYEPGEDPIFLYGHGYIEINHAGVISTCQIPTSSLTTTAVDPYKYLDFHLLSSLQACGLTIQADDSVKVFMYFAVNDEGPYPNTFYLVPELRAGFYANIPAKTTCGNYGNEIKIGKNRALVSGPNNTAQPMGCDTTYLNYKIIPINSGYALTNPAEHRPSIAIDSITFDYEPFLLNGFTSIKVQASIVNHPVYGDGYYDIGELDNSGHFTATFDTITNFSSILNIVNYAAAIKLMMIPRCESMTGSFDGNPDYDFDVNIYYKGNYHTFNFDDTSCLKDTIYNNPNDITYSNPPEVGLENLGDPVTVANGNIVTWVLRQCNTTNYADANVSWLSIEDITPDANILSIKDVTDPANITNLTLNNTPSGGFYVNTNGLMRAVATNTPDDICNVIEIQAQMNDCGQLTANINSGWNCSTFDPTTHPFCVKTTLALTGESKEPLLSIIQNSGQAATAFCDTIPVELAIKNTQKGRDFNMTYDFLLPPNISIVPGSFEIAWPASAGFAALGTDPTYINSTIEGDYYSFNPFSPYPYLQANGLPQVSTTSATDSNEMVIRYRLLTDCGFSSGRTSTINISGEEFCGDPTDTTGFSTFPFFILGSEPDPANQLLISETVTDTVLGTFPIGITITNIGDSITGPNDKITVLLSAGINYIPNSATSADWVVGEPTITNNNGITNLVWYLPEGLGNGASASFQFMLSSLELGCGSSGFQIGFTSARETQDFCAATGSNCSVDIITSDLKIRDLFKLGSPSVIIESLDSDTLCAGQPIDIVATGTNDITWIAMPSGDTLGTGNPLTLIPDVAITSVIATVPGDTCLVTTDTIDIVVLESPLVTLPQDTTINEGDTLLINGIMTTNIPTTFEWNPTSFLDDSTIVTPFAFPDTTILYYLSATGNTGCVSTDSILITVIPKIDTLACSIFNIQSDSVDFKVVCGFDLDFPINIDYDSLSNYVITINGSPANNLIQPNLDSIGYYGLINFGTSTGPFSIEWTYDDSTYTSSTIMTIGDLLTQMNTWDAFGNWYYDIDNQRVWGGAIFHEYQALKINNGSDYDEVFALEKMFDLSKLNLPIGTNEIIIFDSTQVCADTILVSISCEKYNPNANPNDCIVEAIYVNQTMIYCIDTNALPGLITSFSNICEDSSHVDYQLNDTTYCVEYLGLKEGDGQACVVICDEYGFCDTINFCTTVVPYDGFAIANNDSFCVMMNTPKVYDILQNDTTWGGIDTVYFVNTPLSGDLVLNADYSITYTPDNDVCDRTERIQYIVCNVNGCDDAFIDICINCDDLVVFTALSPNGDGANDVFFIANIEDFPNNQVQIYNRWGNRVFNKAGYTNDWKGTWIDNTIVPDGTYYYVIHLNDKENRIFKGYLEIRR